MPMEDASRACTQGRGKSRQATHTRTHTHTRPSTVPRVVVTLHVLPQGGGGADRRNRAGARVGGGFDAHMVYREGVSAAPEV